MKYQTCSRCVMNNGSDKYIYFDDNGICNYCKDAYIRMKTTYKANEIGNQELAALINSLKKHSKNRKYSCIMGVSGGIDSSYLFYLGAAKWNLNMAVLHINDGFDSEITTQNIQKLSKSTNIDIIEIKPDPNQYNDLLLAYLKAGVPNLAAPQDNVLFAFLYKFARKNKIPYFLSGGNFTSESILQKGNSHSALDLRNIKDIHRKFGRLPIDKLHFTSFEHKALDILIHKIDTVRPLDLMHYDRDEAFTELNNFCGFQDYGGKHLENYLTAFAQNIWFPEKFGVDKRISHYSSLIVSEQMSREEALKKLEEPICTNKEREFLIEFVSQKLNITANELNNYINEKGVQHNHYKTDKLHVFFNKIRNFAKK